MGEDSEGSEFMIRVHVVIVEEALKTQAWGVNYVRLVLPGHAYHQLKLTE